MTQAFGVRWFALGLFLSLAACSDYEVKFNDRPLYTPAPLFTDYRLADAALETCIEQTVRDKRITSAEDLNLLVCTSAGIATLEGLGTFAELKQLNLAHNIITEVTALSKLAQLRRLDLSDNAITDLEPLMTLAHLEWVNLEENEGVDCEQVARLRRITEATVVGAERCDAD